MASKFLFFHMLFALAMLAVRLEGRVVLPVVHFIDAVSGENPTPIDLTIKAGDVLRLSPQLKAGEDYRIRVQVDDVYFVVAVFGLRFTEFHAYEPARDKGRAAVYWRADDDGFAFSYDNTHWNLVAPWDRE